MRHQVLGYFPSVGHSVQGLDLLSPADTLSCHSTNLHEGHSLQSSLRKSIPIRDKRRGDSAQGLHAGRPACEELSRHTLDNVIVAEMLIYCSQAYQNQWAAITPKAPRSCSHHCHQAKTAIKAKSRRIKEFKQFALTHFCQETSILYSMTLFNRIEILTQKPSKFCSDREVTMPCRGSFHRILKRC